MSRDEHPEARLPGVFRRSAIAATYAATLEGFLNSKVEVVAIIPGILPRKGDYFRMCLATDEGLRLVSLREEEWVEP